MVDPRTLQSRISHFKARNLSPAANAFPAPAPNSTYTQSTQQKKPKDLATEEFMALYTDYQSTLEASNILDYDDLLLRCLELLTSFPECVSNIEAVLIDEFQDTNVVQYQLMKAFAWKAQRITVVGDPDQSIYGFRAAEIGNVRRMQRHYSTLVVTLEENYRSSASILQAALAVIQQDSRRIDKTLTATHPIGPSPVLRKVPTPSKEAEWIVNEIRRVRAATAGMVALDGIAVLVRSAHLTRHVETMLTRQGLPYKMVGGVRFFDRAEVKIVVDYLRVLQNPAANDAVVRVVNTPSRKVGESTIKALLEHAEKGKKSLWDVISRGVSGQWGGIKVSKPAERGMESFFGLMTRTREKLDDPTTTLAEVIENLLAKIGYETYMHNQYPEPADFEARWANIQELLLQAREIRLEDDDFLPEISGISQQQPSAQNTPRAALEQFLANAALVNQPRESDEKPAEITISTIHAAKGLEWPIVFVPAVYEGSIPHSRAEDVDEERRLLYVAMTRAQALLYLSCPLRNSNGGDRVKLSSFVDTPAVTRLLAKKASDLRFSDVQTLSQILSAQCPSEMMIEAAWEKAGLESRSDDVIPDCDPEDKEKQNPKTQQARHPVNNGFRSAREFATTTTTQEKLKGKMTTADKLAASFKSAGSHLEELKTHHPNVTCEADRVVQARRTTHEKMMKTTTTTKGKTTATGQQSLTSFFTKKPPPPPSKSAATIKPKLPTATTALKTLSTSSTLREQISSLPAPIIPKRGATGGEDFILLSSSPPRTVKKPKVAPTKTAMGLGAEMAEVEMNEPPSSPAYRGFSEMMQDTPDAEPELPIVLDLDTPIQAKPVDCEAGEEQEVQLPDMLPSLPPLPPPPPPKTGRRTLGVRRTMNGWANRARK
jgi:DNA helicase-2/ATP-dependent DNA helicase PcrA